MSNICFNCKQDDTLSESYREPMAEMQRQWDAANDVLNGALKAFAEVSDGER